MEQVGQNGAPPAGSWPAPAAAGPVRASLSVPGSKSMTNRALVLAALADGPGTIAGPLHSRDTLLMRAALTALGATIADKAANDAGPAGLVPSWQVTPGQPGADVSVDVGNAGTVLRFAPPVAALTDVRVAFHGDTRAAERPVGPVLAALRELGAVIDDGGRSAIPFTVRGAGALPGGAVTVDASASSQFVSGLPGSPLPWQTFTKIVFDPALRRTLKRWRSSRMPFFHSSKANAFSPLTQTEMLSSPAARNSTSRAAGMSMTV